MIDAYIDRLDDELRARGVPGSTRRRIRAESTDHLRSDRDAESRFGEPAVIAQRFADELGTTAALRNARRSFGALAFAGLVFGALAAGWVGARWPHGIAVLSAPQAAVIAFTAVAPQVSFVSGALALLRALRRRGRSVLPSAEVAVIRHRVGVALAAGIVSVAAAASFCATFTAHLPAWSMPVAVAGCTTSAALLSACFIALVRESRLRVEQPGGAGDVFDDLGADVSSVFAGSPWLFASVVATIVGAAVFVPGLLADDGFDGALRGLAEAAACFGGYAVFN
ncbi:MAG: hypothetical protein JOY80_12000, partial [Candidatus Dormibacteraeota bacterium]|nr:hypothetical protein [Candidatus Dormibacteraeota bacterium]